MKGSNLQAMNKEDYVFIDKHKIHDFRENGIKNGWQMMLYCKIYAMSAQKGFCTATNKYFASFIGTTERNIQKYLSDLKAKGFIKIYEVKAGSHTESRKIYPQINPEENLNNPINLSNNNPPTSNHSSHPCPTVHPTHEQLGHDPRTVGSQPTNKWVVTHEQMDTQVIDSNSIVIDSKAYVNDLMKSYNDLGQELGAITSDVASSADSWLRQGRTMAETNQLIQDSMVLLRTL